MTGENEQSRNALPLAAGHGPVDQPVGRPVPKRAGLLAQIEACRRQVAQWPEWMLQERTVPAWMANNATDL